MRKGAAMELGMIPSILARLLLATERLILSNLDLVTTISPAMRRQLIAKTAGQRRVDMFPNWVDGQAIAAAMTKMESNFDPFTEYMSIP